MNIQGSSLDHSVFTSSLHNPNDRNDLLVPYSNVNNLTSGQHDDIYGMVNDAIYSRRSTIYEEPTKIITNYSNHSRYNDDNNTLSTAMLSDHTSVSLAKMNDLLTPKAGKGKLVLMEEKKEEIQKRPDIEQDEMMASRHRLMRKTSIRIRGNNCFRGESSDSVVLPPGTPLDTSEPSVRKHPSNDETSTIKRLAYMEKSSTAVLDVSATTEHNPETPATLKRCLCSWKNCRAYQKAFRDAKHAVFEGVVTIKIFKDHRIGMNYKQCLDRNLGITKEPEWKKQEHNGSVKLFCKYIIAKHHFTQSHMEKYNGVVGTGGNSNDKTESTKSSYSFLKPFSVVGAKKYLYAIDPKEVFVQPNEEKDINNHKGTNETFYMQCPNVPQEVVKMEFYKALENQKCPKLLSGEAKIAKFEEKGTTLVSSQTTWKPSKSIQEPENSNDHDRSYGGNARGPLVSSLASNSKDDGLFGDGKDNDIRFHSSHNKLNNQMTGKEPNDDKTITRIKVKDAENKELKDQLEFMKSQLSVLHDMVSKLQVQQFEMSYSNSFGNGSFSANFNNSSRNRLSTLNQKKKSQQQKQQQTPRRSPRLGINRLARSNSLDVPDEINVDDDDSKNDDNNTTSTTDMNSRFGSIDGESNHHIEELLEEDEDEAGLVDDDESEVEDLKTVATVGTFVSKYKQVPKDKDADKKNADDNDTSTSFDEELEEEDQYDIVEESVTTTSVALSNCQQINNSLLGNDLLGNKQIYSHGGNYINEWDDEKSSSVDEIDQSLRLEEIVTSRRNVVPKDSRTDRSSNITTKYVTNLIVSDPYGEKGEYTGTVDKVTSMPHGYGRLNYEGTGRWYEGDWKYGRWTGRGQLSNHEGDIYEGELLDDHKHGYGVMRFADKRIYEGQFKHGQMSKGKMTYKDGSYYDGSWLDGMRHGYGRCIFPDNSVYEGNFVNGEFHGKGKMIWNDNGWYYGDWNMGNMEGYGKEVLPNGTVRHDGKWRKGRPIRV